MLAAWHPPAGLALDETRESPPVLEQNHLLAGFQRAVDGVEQCLRKTALHPLLEFQPFDVHHLDVGHLHVAEALVHTHIAVASLFRQAERLHARCGSAEQHLRPVLACQHRGGGTGMVARGRILLLERVLMLLVHDDQSEVAEREEHARAYAQNQAERLLAELFLVDRHTVGIHELRVIDTQLASEHRPQTVRDLSGQRDFGQQVEHLLALADIFLNQVDIYFRLAAGGHSVQ